MKNTDPALSMLKVGSTGVTRGGNAFRVISTNARINHGDYDIVVLIDLGNSNGEFIEWYDSSTLRDGHLPVYPTTVNESDLDISSIKE